MSTADVSKYGQVLQKILKKNGFSKEQLLEQLADQDYGITRHDLCAAMHTNMSPYNFELVLEPAKALELPIEDAYLLADAYNSDLSIKPPPTH